MTNLNTLIEQRQGELMKFVEPALDNGFDNGYRGADTEKAQKAYRDRYAWALDIRDFDTQTATEAYRQALLDLQEGLPEDVDHAGERGNAPQWRHGHNTALQTVRAQIKGLLSKIE
jgi:hypothetical protein